MKNSKVCGGDLNAKESSRRGVSGDKMVSIPVAQGK